jgi:hypothetical protein
MFMFSQLPIQGPPAPLAGTTPLTPSGSNNTMPSTTLDNPENPTGASTGGVPVDKQTDSSTKNSSVKIGATVGGIIGGLVILALIIIIWQLVRQNRILRQSQGHSHTSERNLSEVVVKTSH